MKLRLTQAGFENFTGQMGVVWFENGLSTTDVLPIDGVRISAAIGAAWEDGSMPNKGEMYLTAADAPAHVGTSGKTFTPQSTAPAAPEAAPAVGTLFTEEQLAKVADEKGIAGLREIGDPIGAKGTSIVGLIAEILKKQANPTKSE
jgi:hypothetical protein